MRIPSLGACPLYLGDNQYIRGPIAIVLRTKCLCEDASSVEAGTAVDWLVRLRSAREAAVDVGHLHRCGVYCGQYMHTGAYDSGHLLQRHI